MSDALEIKLPDHGYIQLSVAEFMYAQLGELFDGRSVSDTMLPALVSWAQRGAAHE